MTKLDDLRSSHVEGATFAAYVYKAESILTAGSDGDVRIYPGLFDDETLSVSLGSKITSLAVKDDFVVLSNEQNEVKSYTLPKMTLENVLLRFTASINNVCISEDKANVAACSSDFSIKYVLRNGTEQKTLTGHSAPVLSICFIGNGMLASNSCDGSLRIWNLSDQKCNTVLDILPKYNSVPDHNNLMSYCAKSQLLAIPADHSIKVISTLTFQEEFVLDKEHTEPVTNVCWSSCGKYLTSSSENGEIFCWDTQTKKCIKKNQHHESKGITCLGWKPDENEILYADNEGQFGTCEMPIESSKKKDDDFGFDDDDDDIIASAVLDAQDEETNDGDIFPTSAAKKGKKRSILIDNDDEDDDGADGDEEHPSKKTRINNMDNFLDDEAEDEEEDEASISLNLIKEGFLEPIRKPAIEEDDDDVASVTSFANEKKSSKQVVTAEIKYFMQPSFQPTSTPVHFQQRYMVWNSVGIIRCRRDDDVSSIDVEFHNASTSHPLHIANVWDNTMAALSETSVVLGCHQQDDVQSKLTCINFGSWDSNKEWNLSMNEDEDIEAVSVNKTQVCVATSKRILRFFTVGGLQMQLLQLPGPVVSMAMHEKEMIAFYHKTTGLNKRQCVGISQYSCKKMKWKLIRDESFFMQPEVTIVWTGYSTEGTPGLVLSSGEILLFHRSQQTWIEIGNTKKTVKNKSDNYWILGIEEQQAQLRCIYCKGANFPPLLPRPIPTFIPFQLPLCEMKTEKSLKEHDLMKNNLQCSNMEYSEQVLRLPVENDGFDRKQMQLLMQLFALACKADREHRAVEVCKLMPNADSINLAIQYASKMKKMSIARRLTELAQRRAEEDEHESEGEDLNEGEQSDEEDIEEMGVEENKENHRKFTPISRNKTSTTGLSRSHSQQRRKSEEIEDVESENEHEKDDVIESASRDISKTKKTNLSENITPKPKAGNPFKLSQQTNSSQKSAAKGTDYFEKLDSQKLSKTKQAQKNINNAIGKKKTGKVPSKSGKIESSFKSKEKIDFNVAKKNDEPTTKKKVTGFQLFLEKQKDSVEESQEDFIPAAMKLWKELSADEKKEWNNKAKQESGETITTTTNNNEPLKKHDTTTNMSTKNKLSSFAFQKT